MSMWAEHVWWGMMLAPVVKALWGCAPRSLEEGPARIVTRVVVVGRHVGRTRAVVRLVAYKQGLRGIKGIWRLGGTPVGLAEKGLLKILKLGAVLIHDWRALH